MFVCIFAMKYSLAQYEEEKQRADDGKVADTSQNDSEEKAVGANNKLCPVDFKKIAPENSFEYTYKGKIYRFDSAKCIEEFKNGPDKYLKEWEEKERFYKINIIYD